MRPLLANTQIEFLNFPCQNQKPVTGSKQNWKLRSSSTCGLVEPVDEFLHHVRRTLPPCISLSQRNQLI